ncbi:unnamed protein product [Microthlaspi erraticum]|uniref:Reverse transcriptase Ty1/copia-type domain-containing protein n=2 Tax=Microthlaspi erraticum TaxID=1685480 RepID=A0A6D2JSP6_9BRAS|nr:unnamed protein product [Microthlaspi erraticum]
MMMVQIYVDDIIFGGTSEKLVENFVKSMTKEFKMSMVGELKYFLGLQVNQTEKGIFISQSTYAKNLLAKPKQSHLQAVKKILRYVKGTVNLGIFYSKGSNRNLAGYCDADWAGCADDRKSTSGGCFFLGNNLIAWLSKKQNSVSLSTAEAEYIALGSCCTQLIWMRQMSADYGMESGPFLVYCDNKSAIDISKNPVQHSRTKHIDIRHHFVRELVEEKQGLIQALARGVYNKFRFCLESKVPMRISYFVMPSCHLNIRKVKTHKAELVHELSRRVMFHKNNIQRQRMITCSALNKIKSFTLHIIGIRGGDMIWPSDLQASNLQALPSPDEATEVATTTSLVVTADGVSEPAEPDVLERHKAKKGEIEDATGLTQIVNQSGSASGRMDGLVAELSGA